MSKIADCAKCKSFAVQSWDIVDGGLFCHCFNEHSSDTFDCDAPAGPKVKDSEESIRLWNEMQTPSE